MIPHERTLVERLRNEPFALVGINTDDDPEKFAKQAKEHKVTWRSSWQGNTQGAICRAFRVQTYPTLFLIDHEGVIREKWIGNPGDVTLDRAIDKLVAAAKAAGHGK